MLRPKRVPENRCAGQHAKCTTLGSVANCMVLKLLLFFSLIAW